MTPPELVIDVLLKVGYFVAKKEHGLVMLERTEQRWRLRGAPRAGVVGKLNVNGNDKVSEDASAARFTAYLGQVLADMRRVLL